MKQVYRQHILSLVVFSVLAALMTFPVLFHMGDSIAGQGGDPWQAMWRFTEKGNLGFPEFFKDLLGTGEARLANLSVWVWMPLHFLFGQPFTYNAVWLLSFILSGYAMALLVRSITGEASVFAPAPMLAGIAYMFLPFHTAHALGHFGAMQMQWIPFIITTALSLFRSRALWKYALLGVLLSIQAWTEHHYMLYLGIFTLLAAWVWRRELRAWHGYSKRGLMLLSLIVVIGVFLPYLPTIKLAATNSGAIVLGEEQTIRFSADAFSFLVPSGQHPLWGDFSHSLFGRYFTGNSSESVQYVGVSLLIALLFFHRHIPVRQKRFWIGVMVVFYLISLGPVLHVYGKVTSIALPYALLQDLPVFSAMRVVARSGAFVGLAVCALFGWVVATNIKTREKKGAIAIGALVLLEFLFMPFPMQSAQLSPVYGRLSSLPGSAVIEVPSATNYTAASRSLYASALHGKTSLGNIALERGADEDAYNTEKAAPGIRQLLYLRTTELLEGRYEFFNQNIAETLPDAMAWLDAHAVIVHTDSLSNAQNDALRTLFAQSTGFTKESFGDADVYILNHAAAGSDGVFLMRGDGWEHVGYDPKRDSVFGEIPSEAYLTIVNVGEDNTAVALLFDAPPSGSPLPVLRAGGQDIPVRQENGKVVYEFLLYQKETNLMLINTGSKNTIVKNPLLRVGEGQ